MRFSDLRLGSLLFLSAILGFSLAQAQSGGAAVKTQVSFILIAGAKAVPDAFVALPRGGSLPVKLSNVRSRPILYDGPPSLVLAAPVAIAPAAPAAPAAGAGAGANAGKATLVSVALPSGSSRVLILLAPAGAGSDKYQAVAVDEDPASVPPGSIRFLNYSGKTVTAQVGKEVLNLGKGPSKPFPVAAKGAEPTEVMVQIGSQDGNNFEKSFTARVSLRPEDRQTYILLPPTNVKGRGVTVVPSRDVIAPPAAPGVRSQAPNR
jgi:hypothetical protein